MKSTNYIVIEHGIEYKVVTQGGRYYFVAPKNGSLVRVSKAKLVEVSK